MKNKSELKIGVLLSYVNLLISMVIPLLYTPVMLRLLGQAEYGLYSLSNSVISYLTLLTLGLGSTIHRYFMKCITDNDKDLLQRTIGLFLTIYLMISFVTLCVGISMTFMTGTFFAQGLAIDEINKLNILIVIMSVSTAVSFVSGIFSSITICYERYLFRRVIELFGTVATPMFNLVMLYFGYGSVGMATVSTILQVATLFINMWFCSSKLNIRPCFIKMPTELLREIFKFTAIVFVGMIADLLYWATDKVLIGAFCGSLDVAVYNIGATFNTTLQSMSSAISGVFGPRVNQMVFSNASMREMSDLLIRVGRVQYYIIALVLSGFIVFGQEFILLWAGENYQLSYYVALLTMIPLAIPLIQNIAFNTIVAQNRHQFRSVLYVILAIANVIGTYFLIPVMGVVGAALCTCIVFVIGHGLIMNWFYYKKIGFDIPRFWCDIAKLSIVPVIMIIVGLYIIGNIFIIDSLIKLLIGIVLYSVIYCVVTWIFIMNGYEKSLIISLLHRIKR